MATLDALQSLAHTTCEEHGLDRENVATLGWSQGAATALALGFRADASWRPRVVVGLAAWLANEPDVTWDFRAGSAGTRVLLVHGSEDEIVPIEQGRSAHRVLDRNGIDVSWIEVRTGHDLEALLAPVKDWLTDALS